MFDSGNLPFLVGATRKRGLHLREFSLAWGISNRKLNESRCNIKGPSIWIGLKMKSLFLSSPQVNRKSVKMLLRR